MRQERPANTHLHYGVSLRACRPPQLICLLLHRLPRRLQLRVQLRFYRLLRRLLRRLLLCMLRALRLGVCVLLRGQNEILVSRDVGGWAVTWGYVLAGHERPPGQQRCIHVTRMHVGMLRAHTHTYICGLRAHAHAHAHAHARAHALAHAHTCQRAASDC